MSTNGIFPTILASTVHDIKNSLSTLMELIHQLPSPPSPNDVTGVRQLEFEANRINHSLMQLLVMYKIDSQKFSLAVEEYPAIDIINEALAQQERLLQLKLNEVSVSCDDDLMGYCDYQQVTNALGSILNNAQRYALHALRISASQENGYLKFCIEDDGEGYPEHLLNADLSDPSSLDWVNGNTGLGLYFVAAIASYHKDKGKAGFVQIDNASRLGGARFCLFLP